MQVFDRNVCWKVWTNSFFMKSSKATCAVRREEFPPVRLNSHRHVARQQIFTYSPFACNNNIWLFFLSWMSLWLLIVATVCSTSCIFLCLPPSGPLSTGMQGQKSFFDTFWAFLYCLDSFWTIRTNYWLLREFEWEKLAKISCVAMLPRSYVFFWLHGRPIPDMTGK